MSFVNIKDFKILESESFCYGSKISVYKILVICRNIRFCFLFILYGYFKTRKKTYFVNHFSLYNQNSSFLLSNEEFAFVQAFKNRMILENSQALELFVDKSKSLDAAVKRKNKIVQEINNKFHSTFQGKLIFKKPDKLDLRQVNYELSEKFKDYFSRLSSSFLLNFVNNFPVI